MREYGKIKTSFWARIGSLTPHQKLIAVYLQACPHGTMLGAFYLPMAYLAGDLGSHREPFGNPYETVPKPFPNPSETLPEPLPNGHATLPEPFRNPSGTVEELFTNGSRTVPERFPNGHETPFFDPSKNTHPADVSWVSVLERELGVIYDHKTQWIYLPGFLRDNPIENPNQAKALMRLFLDVPPSARFLSALADDLRSFAAFLPQDFFDALAHPEELLRHPNAWVSQGGSPAKPLRNRSETVSKPEQSRTEKSRAEGVARARRDAPAAAAALAKETEKPKPVETPPDPAAGKAYDPTARIQLVELFRDAYRKRFKALPRMDPKDLEALEDILGVHTHDTVATLITAFIQDTDPWVTARGHRLRFLPGQADRLLAATAPQSPVPKDDSAARVKASQEASEEVELVREYRRVETTNPKRAAEIRAELSRRVAT